MRNLKTFAYSDYLATNAFLECIGILIGIGREEDLHESVILHLDGFPFRGIGECKTALGGHRKTLERENTLSNVKEL